MNRFLLPWHFISASFRSSLAILAALMVAILAAFVTAFFSVFLSHLAAFVTALSSILLSHLAASSMAFLSFCGDVQRLSSPKRGSVLACGDCLDRLRALSRSVPDLFSLGSFPCVLLSLLSSLNLMPSRILCWRSSHFLSLASTASRVSRWCSFLSLSLTFASSVGLFSCWLPRSSLCSTSFRRISFFSMVLCCSSRFWTSISPVETFSRRDNAVVEFISVISNPCEAIRLS